MPTLLDRIQIGDLELANRVVMAPMTQPCRSVRRSDGAQRPVLRPSAPVRA